MGYLLQTLLSVARGRRPQLVCNRATWRNGIRALASRCRGGQESGAFLLGTVEKRRRRIQQFLFYDDIDPTCFARGIVEFDGRKLGRVWEYCRKNSLTVVADVHVHPGSYHQSESDRDNPIIAENGHLALIIPHFASKGNLPGKIGIYEYLGSRRWRDHSAKGTDVMRVDWWQR